MQNIIKIERHDATSPVFSLREDVERMMELEEGNEVTDRFALKEDDTESIMKPKEHDHNNPHLSSVSRSDAISYYLFSLQTVAQHQCVSLDS